MIKLFQYKNEPRTSDDEERRGEEVSIIFFFGKRVSDTHKKAKCRHTKKKYIFFIKIIIERCVFRVGAEEVGKVHTHTTVNGDKETHSCGD
jgi:hypothetical protein